VINYNIITKIRLRYIQAIIIPTMSHKYRELADEHVALCMYRATCTGIAEYTQSGITSL